MAEMKVTLIDHMGTDLSVVDAARVSFDKKSEWEWVPTDIERVYTPKLSEKDSKLISYLDNHNHWSPFAHAFLSFRIKAPIFVARQLQKHTVGLAWNEVSRRYVDTTPEFYEPVVWRKRAENVKQGSSDDFVREPYVELSQQGDPYYNNDRFYYEDMSDAALKYYNTLLKADVCPEQARMILPQSMMTEWIWSGSLYAFSRVCTLRLDSHSQKETGYVAERISEEVVKLFPVAWGALQNDKANADKEKIKVLEVHILHLEQILSTALNHLANKDK